ncbi:unnamed protein product [Nezara viridula]|uniref:Tubulin alpha chain n=1 Tax=Nezara viridula TaxID=85310 RepID=A0A9P0MHJ6_NEZVI|nr:unnamed protein product [Nezara viridula]
MAVVSLHIGQAGVQLGNVCWSQYGLEHSVTEAGEIELKDNPSTMTIRSGEDLSGTTIKSRAYDFGDNQDNDQYKGMEGLQVFYQELSNGRWTPRAIFVDLESTVIDEVKNGSAKGLFSPHNLVTGIEDAANNYARGFCSAGKSVHPIVEDSLRAMVEVCDKIQGFMMTHSTGGGTGSGYHALISEYVNEEFTKNPIIGIEIFPSPKMSTAVVEPYNTLLNKHATLDKIGCVFLCDNEAMYNICQNKLGVDSPNYQNLNRLLSTTISSVTSSLRFKGSLNADFVDFQTNLVPFPKIHFPVITYAPIVNSRKISHESLSILDLTYQVFHPQSRLSTCDDDGRYIACCLLYRGDVTPKDVNHAIAMVKDKKFAKFVDWSPTGFKVGINHKTAESHQDGSIAAPKKTVCMLANTTAVTKALHSLNNKYDMMLKRRAFVHWYTGEGMMEEEFHEAQADLLTLETDYHCLL